MTTVFEASVPRRKRTELVAPRGGREGKKEEEPDTKKGDGSSGAGGSAVSSSAPAVDGSDAVASAAQLKSEEEERKRKGKMLAAVQSLPIRKNDAPLQPPVPKLMGDAGAQFLAKASKKRANKKRKRPGNVFRRDGASTSSAGANGTDVSLDKIDVVDDALRDILRDLGASPERIYRKRLWKSDRAMNQHRLLISCKNWETKHGVPFPLDEILTPQEKPLVRVQAYDRRGNSYEFDCKKLACNDAYRLIHGWGNFLTNNGLVVREDAKPEEVELSMVELWKFRSPKLEVGVIDQAHGLGPLGLVIVHYRQGESPHADAAIAEILAAGGSWAAMPRGEAIPVHQEVVPVLGDAVQVHEDAVLPVLGGAVQVHEVAMPVLGDAVQVHGYAAPILEDAGHAHEDAMPVMVDGEADEDMLEAANGLIMLRNSSPKDSDETDEDMV